MKGYMQEPHQRFFQKPECEEARAQVEELRQQLRERLTKSERQKLKVLRGACHSPA